MGEKYPSQFMQLLTAVLSKFTVSVVFDFIVLFK